MDSPAGPILASNIWLSQKLDGESLSRFAGDTCNRRMLSTGIRAIDEALAGGLEYGRVHAITSEFGQSSQEFVHALVISHLLTCQTEATVIDSTLSFDVQKLYQLLQSTVLEPQSDGENVALKHLHRLRIMKVFDHIGLTEAIAELRESLETIQEAKAARPVGEIAKSTIDDSESEDEMLDDHLQTGTVPPAEVFSSGSIENARGLLIVDSVSRLIMPLIKNNYARGQAMLSTFMRSLSHLTRAHGLCTVVLSDAASKPAAEDEALSIFRSCTIRPSLGSGFGFLVDMQIYLHKIPTRRPVHGHEPEMSNIFEIVQDQLGGRLGRWAPFVCEADGSLRSEF